MPLIVKGNTNIVSKQDAQKKAVETSEKVKENGLEKLSDSQKEVRQEILNAKRHREFMLRVQKQKAKSKEHQREVEKVLATPEVVVEARAEKAKVIEATKSVALGERPVFEAMTKKELDIWAEENLGMALDRRKTKSAMIEEIEKNL